MPDIALIEVGFRGPAGYRSGAGGNGFAVIVFPSANANVVQA